MHQGHFRESMSTLNICYCRDANMLKCVSAYSFCTLYKCNILDWGTETFIIVNIDTATHFIIYTMYMCGRVINTLQKAKIKMFQGKFSFTNQRQSYRTNGPSGFALHTQIKHISSHVTFWNSTKLLCPVIICVWGKIIIKLVSYIYWDTQQCHSLLFLQANIR